MKKIVFFVPAIIYALFYGFIIIGVGLLISPLVYAWICFFLISGFLLYKGKFGGGFIGMLPGIHFIYMSTQDTGQVLPVERPSGIIIIAFYLLCSCFIFYRKKCSKRNNNEKV
ncbi:hypothetical protein [uncultured Robinsoniella sp.]|uniref:hypothetical protein n=1 Tax=uncultured Robinsoniella sp. TaxID=904190 RepID=UPI00374E7774